MIKLIIVFILLSIVLDITSLILVVRKSKETRWNRLSEINPPGTSTVCVCRLINGKYDIGIWEGTSFHFPNNSTGLPKKVIWWKLLQPC